MNRLDTTITADMPTTQDVTILSPERLTSWDAGYFSMVVALAKAPAAFRVGLGDSHAHLIVAEDRSEETVATLPLTVAGETLSLELSNQALDGLVELLGDDGESASGANLSLDAVEALCTAVLSPLGEVEVGRADWGSTGSSRAAIKLNDVTLPLVGTSTGVLAMQNAMIAANAALPSPFALMGQPLVQRLAVGTERVFALVHLDPDEWTELAPGWGLVLDTYWPEGRTLVGRRFVGADGGWRAETEMRTAPLLARSSERLQMLDDLLLETDTGDIEQAVLELVSGDQVVARGRIVCVIIDGVTRAVFEVDQLV